MRKIFSILFALVLVLSFSLMMATPVAAANTLTVDTGQPNVPPNYWTIQAAIATALPNDTIMVAAGTYVEVGQIVINKNLTIVGVDKTTTIIKPAGDTGSSSDARGWFLVTAGNQFNLSNVTLDGSGHKVYQAIRYKGSGSIANCIFNNMQYEPSGTAYMGYAVAAMGDGKVDVTGCTLTAIGRVGVIYFGASVTGSTFSNNTYTGKGTGNWLDYGVEVGNGATATITGNTITDCEGLVVASPANWTSAAIIDTTSYGSGSTAIITGNNIYDNSYGVWIGGTDADTAIATITSNNIYNNSHDGVVVRAGTNVVSGHFNNIYSNVDYGVNVRSGTTTHDFEYNWWGDASGPSGAGPGTGDAVSTFVDYSPWLGATCGTSPMTWYTNDSIQAAVDAASPGDTVNVAAGTYDEQVVITKSLTLQGAGNTTIIRPSSAAKLTTVLNGLFWYGGTKNIAGIIVANVAGGSVTIKNLKVDESLVTTKPSGADYLAGIFYRETGGVVDTVTIAGTGAWSSGDRAYGMYLSAGTNAVSVEGKGSTITNYDKNGIEVMGNTLTVNVHHNTITGRGNITDEAQNGVSVGRDAVATVNYNTISNLAYYLPTSAVATGILIYHYVTPTGKSATANGNTITNCQVGIMFKNANGSAQDNIVSGGTVGLDGIFAQPNYVGTYTVSFVHNTVSGMTKNAAIDAETFASASPGNWATLIATISNNILTGGYTTADGIYVGGSGGSVTATISGNTISGCPEHGINLGDACVAGATITGNTIINNAMSGLYIGAAVNATNVSANFNNIVGNTLYGANNAGTGTLNATYNWWGSSSGPYHATNPSGTGDNVSDYVDFEPWLVVENPTVTTQAATSITTTTATLNMSFTVGGYGSVNVRFAYKKSSDTTWTNTTWVPKTADGTYAAPVIGLSSNTQYAFRAQLKYEDAEFGETTLNGTTLQFTTLRTPPTVTTQAATDVVPLHAILHMSYTVGDFSPVQVRFAYKKSAGTEWSYTSWVSKGADGTDSAQIILLVASATQYDFKAQLKYDSTVIEGTTTLHFTTGIPSCFIATAAYGTPTAKQIDVLREFRDDVLLKSTVGSRLVDLYYQLSPPVANFIAGNELLRTLVRELVVDPIVWVVQSTGGIWQN